MTRPKNTRRPTNHSITSYVDNYPSQGQIDASASKKRTRKARISEFADYTGVAGVYNIKRSKSWIRRIIWIILWLAAWGAGIYQVVGAVSKYLSYPINVVVSMRYDENASFPAVTICNINPIRKSKYRDNIKGQLEEDPFQNSIEELSLEDLKEGKHTRKKGKTKGGKEFIMNAEAAYRKQILGVIYDSEINITENGHQIHEMLLDCSYQGIQCYPEDFKSFTHGQYGNCYSIRFNRTDLPSMSGPDSGLTLTLLAQYEEYMKRVAPSAGYKVEIHDSHNIPVPEDRGFTISPGFETSVGVRRIYIKRQPLPYNGTDCVDINERQTYMNKSIYTDLENSLDIQTIYSNAVCTKSCYTKMLAKKCNCVDPSVVTLSIASKTLKKKFRACNLGEPVDFLCMHEVITNKTLCGPTECPNACEENSFQLSATSALWPTDGYLETSFNTYAARAPRTMVDDIIEQLKYEVYDDDMSTWNNETQLLMEKLSRPKAKLTRDVLDLLDYDDKKQIINSIRNNLAQVRVFYQELNYESIVETAAMDHIDLLVNLGGTVGLWIGMCMLTVVEVLELFFDLAMFNLSKYIAS